MNKCLTCQKRWHGNMRSPNFAEWHCRKSETKPFPVIGDDKALKLAKGCESWQK